MTDLDISLRLVRLGGNGLMPVLQLDQWGQALQCLRQIRVKLTNKNHETFEEPGALHAGSEKL